jgi:hypothetical protein
MKALYKIIQFHKILTLAKHFINSLFPGGEMKDKHKLGSALVLLIVIIVLAISILLKTPLTKGEKVLKDEVKSEI